MYFPQDEVICLGLFSNMSLPFTRSVRSLSLVIFIVISLLLSCVLFVCFPRLSLIPISVSLSIAMSNSFGYTCVHQCDTSLYIDARSTFKWPNACKAARLQLRVYTPLVLQFLRREHRPCASVRSQRAPRSRCRLLSPANLWYCVCYWVLAILRRHSFEGMLEKVGSTLSRNTLTITIIHL